MASLSFITFQPKNIPGCFLWLDANDPNGNSTVPALGSTVSTWVDKSGSNNSVIASGSPLYSNYQGNNAIYINSNYLSNGKTYQAQNTTAFFVFSVPTTINDRSYFQMGANPNSSSGDTLTLFVDAGGVAKPGGTASGRLYYGDGGTQALTIQYPTATATDAVPFNIQTVRIFSAPTVQNYRNGTLQAQKSGTITRTAQTGLVVGTSNAGWAWSGYYSEVILFNTILSDNQRSQVEAYLGRKWNLLSSLPSTNPYLNMLPPQMFFSKQTVIKQTASFLGTGAVQTWTVPAGVYNFKFFLWGSGGTSFGGGEPGRAGMGGYVEGNLSTTPGTQYYIVVGRYGATGIGNGGGSTGATSGGGFSGIFSGSPAANNVIAIAGGGGGGGIVGAGYAGSGGYPSGSSATGSGGQGGGGTQTAGGAGAGGGSSGTQLQGGNSYGGDNGGGGGGGGWYGGGAGGAQGAGGGGSSTYISSVINPYLINGTPGDNTNPSIAKPAPNESSPYWISPYGRAQQYGLVVIGYSVSAPVNPVIFSYTGSYQTYTVGSTSSLYVYMWGAGGSGNNQGVNGGAGAFLSGILSVTPGETLRLIVGKGGVPGGQNATDAQGYGGSSLGAANSAQGGGRSAIQRDAGGGSYTEIVTVGGGGGAGYYTRPGGAGSYTSQGHRGFDQVLTTAYLSASISAGGGGGSNTGGQGAYGKTASDGVQFRGGDVILSYGNPNGGGGGGGWYGGGGGSGGTPGEGAPGGGGSSYSLNLTGVSGEDSAGQPAPGTSSSYYPSGSIIAAGGISNTQNGGDGYIVIVPISAAIIPPIQYRKYPVAVASRVTLAYSGSYTTVTVPAGANFMKVNMWGAGGEIGYDNTWYGGAGAYVEGYLSVTPGETLRLIVGAKGNRRLAGDQYGGCGYGSASWGGGRTAVQRNVLGTYTDVVVAGAGGGSGGGGTGNPGGGGAATCSGIAYVGRSGNLNYLRQTANNGVAGGGGGQSSGGTGGSGNASGNGSKGQGGSSINNYSGGGGGGWYGGGGGTQNPNDHGSGGGGSSYVDLLQNFVGFDGQGSIAGNAYSPLWVSPVGNGDRGSQAGDGLMYYQFFASI
jgi:hypothetical protein